MSRVLFLAPTPPWPADNGGRIRTSSLLRHLSKDHEITLACVAPEGEVDPQPTGIEELCAHLEIHPRQEGSTLRRLSGPVQEQWFGSRALEARLGALRAGEFDLLHVDELCLIRHLPARSEIPVVQHHHKLDLELAEALGDGGARQHLELERWKRMEQESLARTRHQVFCSEADAARFQDRHAGVLAHVVPNGVDTHAYDRTGPPRYARRLLILGDLDYAPNRRGLLSFLEGVWPHLREAEEDLELSIVGRGTRGPELQDLPPGVEWIGEVDDPRPWLARATALVVPIDVGGGSRLKILEAAAARCPVVTTRVGLEGLDLVPGEHVVAVDSIANLGASLRDVLGYPERAAGRAIYARELVHASHDWKVFAGALAEAWQRAQD